MDEFQLIVTVVSAHVGGGGGECIWMREKNSNHKTSPSAVVAQSHLCFELRTDEFADISTGDVSGLCLLMAR